MRALPIVPLIPMVATRQRVLTASSTRVRKTAIPVGIVTIVTMILRIRTAVPVFRAVRVSTAVQQTVLTERARSTTGAAAARPTRLTVLGITMPAGTGRPRPRIPAIRRVRARVPPSAVIAATSVRARAVFLIRAVRLSRTIILLMVLGAVGVVRAANVGTKQAVLTTVTALPLLRRVQM